MEIGLALPQMAEGLDRGRLVEWCAVADGGPFSSISAGERITFHNLDGFTLCTAAAALTQRVRVFLNVAVLPWHSAALVAKELASLDVVSGGRLDIAVGVGGRTDDYLAMGVGTQRRHQRLDDAVAELRRLWAGGLAADGAPVGPPPLQPNGPAILASAMGPAALARAARWADGVSAFTLSASADEATSLFNSADAAWEAAARSTPPRHITGSFVALGDEGRSTLDGFATRYLNVFGEELARALAEAMPLTDDDALLRAFDAMESAGCDEYILVPASSDPALAHALAAAVSRWRG